MEGARREATEIARDVLRNYSLVLLGLVALVVLQFQALLSGPLFAAGSFVAARIAWFGLAWAVLAAAVFVLSRRRELPSPGTVRIPVIAAGLASAFLFALLLRLLPLAKTELPLGYDYGFYEAAMEHYEQAGSTVPVTTAPDWIQLQFEPGLLLLHRVLHEVGGLGAFDHLRSLWPVLSALLFLPVYAAARSLFGPGQGLVAAGFTAASFTLFTVHEYLYEKNVLGLWLLVGLFWSLHRRAWVAGGLLLGALGLWHRPTFLLAAASLLVVGGYDLARRRNVRPWLTTAAVSLPMFLPVWLLLPQRYFDLAFQVAQSAEVNVGHAAPEGGGTFFDFLTYQNAAVTYLPLALAGTVLLFRLGQALVPAVAFALAFVNVWLRAVFFNRFIIMLDLVSTLLVGAALLAAVPAKKKWVAPAVALFLLALTAVPTWREAARDPGPPFLLVTDAQREGIAWMREALPANATVLADNLRAPYVAAEAGRRTYGPGLFDDPHVAAEWRRFFTAQDPGSVEEFLSAYDPPLYVYHTEGGPGLGTSKFREPQFSLVYDAGGAKVWRYEPEA